MKCLKCGKTVAQCKCQFCGFDICSDNFSSIHKISSSVNYLSVKKQIDNANLEKTIYFGRYPQGPNGEIKPIEWILLEKNHGKGLYISKYALDCQPYITKPINTIGTWEKCALRKWLNKFFLKQAFSSKEIAQIIPTKVLAYENPEYSTSPGNATTDKIFLLSILEVEKYFKSHEERKVAPSEYAKKQGAFTSSEYKTLESEVTCWWWLRSPGKYSAPAPIVCFDGEVGYEGGCVVGTKDCVRPALWIDLEYKSWGNRFIRHLNCKKPIKLYSIFCSINSTFPRCI